MLKLTLTIFRTSETHSTPTNCLNAYYSLSALKDSDVEANKWVHGAMTKWDEEVMAKRDKKTLSSERTSKFTQKDVSQT